MADLYGELTSDNSIKYFYVVPDSGPAGDNQLLIVNVERDESNKYPILKKVSGYSGYKYKWTESAITEKTDQEIKDSLGWKEQKRAELEFKTSKDIYILGEDKFHSLVLKDAMNRLNSGPALIQAEIDDIQTFVDARQSKIDGFHSSAEGDNFSRLNIDSTASNSATVDVKKPVSFAVNDEITIVDYDDGKRETAQINDITSNTLTFATALTNSSKYKKNKSWVFKAQ